MLPDPVYRSDTRACRIYCGDAFTLLPELVGPIRDRRIHIISDPPYSSGGQFRADRNQRTRTKYQHTGTVKEYPEFTGDSRDSRALFRWLVELLIPAHAAAANGSHLVMFSDWRQLATMQDIVQAAGFVFRGIAVWDKTSTARPTRNGFRLQCEFMIHASRGPLPRSQQAPCLPGVFSLRIDPREKRHITAKPLALMRELVRLAQPGDLVVDPFAGSGTTLAACVEAGIESIGIEQSPDYCAIAAARCDATHATPDAA